MEWLNNMRKRVILCVDDDKVLLKTLKEQILSLFNKEYTVEISDNPNEALELLKDLIKEHEVLVISDYIMPEMKGDELLENVYKISPKTLNILLTGQASLDGLINSINNAYLFKFMEKPWDKNLLKEFIKDAFLIYDDNTKNETKPSEEQNSKHIILNKIRDPLMDVKEKMEATIKLINAVNSGENDDKQLYDKSLSEIDKILNILKDSKEEES